MKKVRYSSKDMTRKDTKPKGRARTDTKDTKGIQLSREGTTSIHNKKTTS